MKASTANTMTIIFLSNLEEPVRGTQVPKPNQLNEYQSARRKLRYQTLRALRKVFKSLIKQINKLRKPGVPKLKFKAVYSSGAGAGLVQKRSPVEVFVVAPADYLPANRVLLPHVNGSIRSQVSLSTTAKIGMTSIGLQRCAGYLQRQQNYEAQQMRLKTYARQVLQWAVCINRDYKPDEPVAMPWHYRSALNTDSMYYELDLRPKVDKLVSTNSGRGGWQERRGKRLKAEWLS